MNHAHVLPPITITITITNHDLLGVLFGSSSAHKTLRKILVENQKLDAMISLAGGVFKPYAGVSTAILIFTKPNSGGTDHVWFYDVDAIRSSF